MGIQEQWLSGRLRDHPPFHMAGISVSTTTAPGTKRIFINSWQSQDSKAFVSILVILKKTLKAAFCWADTYYPTDVE
jgi:hypothetical protein